MFTIPPRIRSIVGRDGAVILDTEHNFMFSLNVTGSKIWEKFQAGLPFDQIAEDLPGL